jgi:hypothetical protein
MLSVMDLEGLDVLCQDNGAGILHSRFVEPVLPRAWRRHALWSPTGRRALVDDLDLIKLEASMTRDCSKVPRMRYDDFTPFGGDRLPDAG